MSGLETVKKINLSISLLYRFGSWSKVPLSDNINPRSIGVLIGAAASKPASAMISSAYLRWEIKIPFLEAETSIPRKYFKMPRSLR
jgi:hypothetical protein